MTQHNNSFQVGESVTWLHHPRGGYGYIIPVAAKIIKITHSMATIEVTRSANGEKVQRIVKIENLR